MIPNLYKLVKMLLYSGSYNILTYSTVTLNTSQWYHVAAVYGGGLLKLYLNGVLVASQSVSGSIAADPTKLTLGRNPLSSTKYFKT